jgi:hypothetical protein
MRPSMPLTEGVRAAKHNVRLRGRMQALYPGDPEAVHSISDDCPQQPSRTQYRRSQIPAERHASYPASSEYGATYLGELHGGLA